MVLGNLFEEEWSDIFQRAVDREIRVMAHDIPKCSGCKFVGTCGGGCRAGAYFAYGSMAREDDLCHLNYSSNIRKLLIGAQIR